MSKLALVVAYISSEDPNTLVVAVKASIKVKSILKHEPFVATFD